MAYRDRSQGFAFAYVDVAKLLSEAKQAHQEKDLPIPPKGTPLANFNRDPHPRSQASSQTKPQAATSPKPQTTANAPQKKAPEKNDANRHAAIDRIKTNLDRLQSLHHKLHAMLDELNQVAKRKKK